MAYRQVITPNTDDKTLVVYHNGKPLQSWRGWCLAVTDASYGISPFASTALNAWNIENTKHMNKDLPQKCYVPIFYAGDSNNWGHVAIAYKDGDNITIWSSPYTDKAYFDVFRGTDAIEQLLRIGYGTTFLGWTEGLNNIPVVEWYDEPTPEPTPEPVEEFKVGDKVVPTRLVDYYGTPLVQYDDYYTITQINGDRAVLSAPRNGQMVVWSAMNTKDIRKV